jgi:hypothetical protein
MLSQTPNLRLDLLFAQQAQKEITVNEALVLLDALVKRSLLEAPSNHPPLAPNPGSLWCIAEAPEAAWSAYPHHMAVYLHEWRFIPLIRGDLYFFAHTKTWWWWDGTGWDEQGR